MNTVISNNRNNGYSVVSSIPLDNGRLLKISTRKADNGGIRSSATVGIVEDGFFTFKLFADYSKTIYKKDCKRVTAKAITIAHDEALESLGFLIADIEDFYSLNEAA